MADGVGTQDPWTVFRNSEKWRPNPPIDEGHFTTLALGRRARHAQRSDEPSSGWLVRTTFEHSRSKDVVPHTGVPATVRDSIPTEGRTASAGCSSTSATYGPHQPSGA